jgi:undecaprenyl pyrophosphate synthase
MPWQNRGLELADEDFRIGISARRREASRSAKRVFELLVGVTVYSQEEQKRRSAEARALMRGAIRQLDEAELLETMLVTLKKWDIE